MTKKYFTLNPDDTVTDASGQEWPTIEDFVLTGIFGWCGCGQPTDACNTVHEALKRVGMRSAMHEMKDGDWEREYLSVQAEEKKWQPDEGAREILWYVLAAANLTDHGGSVPGWLNDKGRAVLALLDHEES